MCRRRRPAGPRGRGPRCLSWRRLRLFFPNRKPDGAQGPGLPRRGRRRRSRPGSVGGSAAPAAPFTAARPAPPPPPPSPPRAGRRAGRGATRGGPGRRPEPPARARRSPLARPPEPPGLSSRGAPGIKAAADTGSAPRGLPSELSAQVGLRGAAGPVPRAVRAETRRGGPGRVARVGWDPPPAPRTKARSAPRTHLAAFLRMRCEAREGVGPGVQARAHSGHLSTARIPRLLCPLLRQEVDRACWAAGPGQGFPPMPTLAVTPPAGVRTLLGPFPGLSHRHTRLAGRAGPAGGHGTTHPEAFGAAKEPEDLPAPGPSLSQAHFSAEKSDSGDGTKHPASPAVGSRRSPCTDREAGLPADPLFGAESGNQSQHSVGAMLALSWTVERLQSWPFPVAGPGHGRPLFLASTSLLGESVQ